MTGDFDGEIENYGLDQLEYDRNGNIMRLRRYGAKQNNSIGIIDQLDYTYFPSSNRLKAVSDTVDEEGFKDRDHDEDYDYDYDVNGNMVKDLNKEIFNIEYNHLNLPTKVEFDTTDPNSQTEKYIAYTYDATGVKLQKTVQIENVSNQNFTQYDNGFIYEHTGTTNPELQFFAQAEGYVEPDGNNNYDYIYQYKDHLGNIRLSYKQGISDLEIIEENNYYPFGLKHKGYNNVVNGEHYPYGYNGKEENEELGLEWLDFGARNYDTSIGRWFNIDPLAEKYYNISNYNYVGANPILRIDPNGMDWYVDGEGNYQFNPDLNEDNADEILKDGERIHNTGFYFFIKKGGGTDIRYLNNNGTVTDKNGNKLDAGTTITVGENDTKITSYDDRPAEYLTKNGDTFSSIDGNTYEFANNKWVKLSGLKVNQRYIDQ